jgi:predicted metal-dependent peptidase
MSKDDVIQCVTEVSAILKHCGASKLYLILHDHPVYWAGQVGDADLRRLKMSRGGTSHKEVFEVLEGKSEKFPLPTDEKIELAICFTDLGTDFPEKHPKFEVIWGVVQGYGDSIDVPFGKKIKVELAKGE